MFRFRAWGLSAALAAGTGVPAVAADLPAAPPRQQTTLFNKLFGPSKPKPGPVARGSAGAPTRPPTVTAPLPAEVVAGALRAEQDAWERRMSVCLKLRQVAVETNDEALQRQVDELERQATALYNSRVAALGVPKVKPALPDAYPADDPLATKGAADRLTAPAAPTPATGTAEAKPTNPLPSTGGVREVGP
jgi:hypothetical protein